jgi:hypothetical protein
MPVVHGMCPELHLIGDGGCRHLLEAARGAERHWSIENAIHGVRDVTHDEECPLVAAIRALYMGGLCSLSDRPAVLRRRSSARVNQPRKARDASPIQLAGFVGASATAAITPAAPTVPKAHISRAGHPEAGGVSSPNDGSCRARICRRPLVIEGK